MRARPVHETIPRDITDTGDLGNTKSETFIQAASQARAILDKTKADLLIWGEAPATGTTMVLRFFPAAAADVDRFGYFGLQTELHLPVDFDEALADLLFAISLATITPKTNSKALTLAAVSQTATENAMGHLQNLPAGITSRERASIQLCFGNSIASLADQRGNPELHQLAIALYQTALPPLTTTGNSTGRSTRLSPGQSTGQSTGQTFDWALTQLNLAACLQATAERDDDLATLEAGIEACEASLSFFTQSGPESNPGATPGANQGANQGMLRATAQNRLGFLLYKMDLQTGDTELLKKSLNAFQAALKVFSRTETPRLWADVMNNFAQAALVLGEQLHSPDVLTKAVNACHATLYIRTKNDNPLLWAATQNNLGSALFMLGKLTRDNGNLEGALEAFTNALGIYEKHDAKRMTAITEKNRDHVKRLIDERSGLGILK